MKKILKLATFLFLLILSFSYSMNAFAQTNVKTQNLTAQLSDKEITDMLFKNSYEVFKDLRNDLGVYRDSILLEAGENYHPSSVAATGVGLMSLAIADKKNWETNALEQAKASVATMIGQQTGFQTDRTANGFYRHFVNMETGKQEWNSEYSTIDTAIFVTGALFAEKYFNDPTLSEAVAELYYSIDFEAALADIDTGGIYLTMNEDGSGGANAITLPYNEYIIVAWLAYNQNINNPESKAVKLWNKHYATSKNLLKKDFQDISLLTDNAEHHLPSFTFLFPYYMVNMFSQSDDYKIYTENAYKADKIWSEQTGKTQPYEWGNGAGASPEGYGYHADAINNNQSLTISPHIISGFLPVNPSGYQDLLDLYTNQKGIYTLQSDSSKEILWRYSIEDPQWKANSIQGIDYSTFLFGLATLDSDLGPSFFQTNNNFFTNIQFDLNGGTGITPPVQYLTVGSSLQKPASEPTRQGYFFTGWNTSADGSGLAWDFVTALRPDNDMTLYAQWEIVTHDVAFDLNGGTGTTPSTQKLTSGDLLQEPTPEPTRVGHTFIGWNTSADGSGMLWDFSTAMSLDNDITLYAQWKVNTHNVSFDLNGGSGATPPMQSIANGEKLQEPTPKPTRSGYLFDGWNTSADGSGTMWSFSTIVALDKDLTLYAQWKKLVSNPIDSENKPTSKQENPPLSSSNSFPKTGEKSNLFSILGLLLIGFLFAVFYNKKRKSF